MAAKKFDTSNLSSLFICIASLILGIVLCINPSGMAILVTRVVGIVLIVLALATFIGYMRNKGKKDLVFAIVEAIFGVLLTVAPSAFVSWIAIIIGAFILVTGVGDLMATYAAYKLQSPYATVKLVMAVITIVVGFVVIVAPFAFVDVAFIIAGVGLIINAVTEIVAIIKK